jgi:GTP-binding protein EngB required for normal cell division
MDDLEMTGDTLRELEQLAREADAGSVADEAHSLAERAAEGRFYVACVGQFKRGKSTLLNALVGTDLLPTGIVPVTSVPTVLRHGDLAARIRTAGGTWTEIDPARLAEFVSEEHNPGNQKGVAAVELFVPSPLLAAGLCFVDTPGLGSVFEANTAATREFVPQIDAALVVLGADPPISGEELALVREIARDVDRFVIVLNKADRASERERAEAEGFTRRVLSERLAAGPGVHVRTPPGSPAERVFHVSALDRLETGQGTLDWDALVQHLQALAHRAGRSLVADAVRRGTARLGERLQHVLAEEAAALRRPIAETEERLRMLRSAAEDAARAVRELGPLFAAEEQRMRHTFAARRARFIDESVPEADAALASALRAGGKASGPAVRRLAFRSAQQIARERVEPWLRESERQADDAYRSAAGRFAELANGLLMRLRASEAWTGLPLPPAVTGEEGLHAQRHFYFHEFYHLASPAGLVPAVQWLADLILPRGVTRRRIERDAREYLHRLLETNASRVENDLKQRLQESRQRLESEIHSVLAGVLSTAERAMERARLVQEEGQEAVRTALTRLESLQARLASLLAQDALIDHRDGQGSPLAEGSRHGPVDTGAKLRDN